MPIIPTPPSISPLGHIPNPLLSVKPKPVFVMRFPNSIGDSEFSRTKDDIWKSDLAKDYHIIAVKNSKDEFEFEMYNADKIERQDWNDLVNKVLKNP